MAANQSVPLQSLPVHDLKSLIISSLENDKALDITVIDLDNKSSIADYMVIASGTSNRHIAAMAQHISEKLKALRQAPLHIEGLALSEWVLIDCTDVIVHLFKPEVREYYHLERMWNTVFPEHA